jgi:hypothetical protein
MESVWSHDQESYVGAGVATGKVGQVRSDDAEEKGYPGPECWALGVRQISSGKKMRMSRKPQKWKGWD